MDVITRDLLIYYISIGIPVLIVLLFACFDLKKNEFFFLNYFSYAFVLFLFLLIGIRKLGTDGFNDTAMYEQIFIKSRSLENIYTKDIGFGVWSYLLGFLNSIRLSFLACTFLSFSLIIWVCNQVSKERWFLVFLGFLVSLYFWNHQVFTIRQGIASAFFLVSLFQNNCYKRLLFVILAISFHQSFIIPAFCILIAINVNNTKLLFLCWVGLLVFSSFFNVKLLEQLNTLIGESRFQYFLHSNSIQELNFRWDVMVFSFTILLVGMFNVFFNQENVDRKYLLFINLYILTNMFIVLLGRSNIMHRFAFLSWFLIPLIVFYPVFKNKVKFSYSNYSLWLICMYLFIISYMGYKLISNGFDYIVYV